MPAMNNERNLLAAERGISIAVGALFALAALNRSATATVLTILGSGLVIRGTTGHCPIYRRLGIAPADACAERARRDECIDAALDDSFPASDPPAWVAGKE